MGHPEKIAILILTYNRYGFVRNAIDSALRQRGVSYRIYVFDNHSDEPLYEIVDGIKKITYVRHAKNIGFAKNYYYAVRYIKQKEHPFIFLLGDDDLLAYPTVLRDLYKSIQTDRSREVIRGGFVTFIGDIHNLTRIYQHQYNSPDEADGDQIYKALNNNITFYSGILFRTENFALPAHKYYDTVSPFLAPLFMLLTRGTFAYFESKITIIARMSHDQLASQIYNEPISNNSGISLALKAVQYPKWFGVYIHELINYKLYSTKRPLIKKYYSEIMKRSGLRIKILSVLIYYSPQVLLGFVKSLVNILTSVRTKKIIRTRHPYIVNTITRYTG